MSNVTLEKAAPVAEIGAPPPATAAPDKPKARKPVGRTILRTGNWVFRTTIVLALLLVFWEVAPRIGLVDKTFLPPFSDVVDALIKLAQSGQLSEHISASVGRALKGFTVAVVVAVPLGIVIGWYRPVAQLLNPVLELFRNTAALALLPVFVLILGIGETSKVALVIYACMFPILLNTISGVRTVDPLLIKSARSLGLSSFRLFQKVILPAALPTIFTGIRLSAAASILVLIAAEMVGARSGLGYLIMASQLNFQIPQMYAGILTIALVGLVFNFVLVIIERRFSRWRTPSNE
ncbi:MAG: ABC transporter permease [Gordonia sp.]|uniref:ABC transporter permease n=1 Tax=Williamsia sp. 1138 TaxID=1903117 RepID=UPI000A122C9D|nr:ABC transporter permease [Williamsia sp. 1138]MBA4025912.1 ABC transporter permease [Gordonia sp. (in: high G+C Gram-positive bacteria)]OZG27992.1 ABC transporter permease [Williamsia sp. 1138]